MMLKFALTKIGDKPSEGSSINSSFGARIRPRPIESIACSPPKLIYWNKVEKGGHFAAWEETELFTREIGV